VPRHTHPKIKNKHSRQHTRAQRERYIEKRFARAKADGSIPQRVSVYPRYFGPRHADLYLQEYQHLTSELSALGYGEPILLQARYGATVSSGGAHPDVLRVMTSRQLREGVHYMRKGIGQLAKDDHLHYGKGQPGCGCCWIEPEDKGSRRTRERRLLREELAELETYGRGEMQVGRKISTHDETSKKRVWT
jgi:hypothetical protein